MMKENNTTLSHQKNNISHINSGIYFVKITTNAGEVVKKVVKTIIIKRLIAVSFN